MRLSDISIRAVLLGLVLSAGVFLGVRYVFGQIWDPTLRGIIILAGALLGALAGGYFTVRQPVYHVMLHVGLVAVLNILLLVVLRMLPSNALLLGGMLVLAFAGALIGQRMPISAMGTPFTSGRSYVPRGYSTPRASLRLPGWAWKLWNPFRRILRDRQAGQLYAQLLRRTRMDTDLADRLIELERRRNPYAGRATLIRNALERLERDNR